MATEKHYDPSGEPDRLVSAPQLLDAIFDPKSRPSLRWLRDQQARRKIPFVRLGRLVFFDPVAVREHLAAAAAASMPKRSRKFVA